MRFVSYLHDNKPGWGLEDGGVIADLTHCEPCLKAAIRNQNLAACAAAATESRPRYSIVSAYGRPVTGCHPWSR